MKRLKTFIPIYLFTSISIALMWLHAQETTTQEISTETLPGDKWATIQQNHKEMLITLDEIDQNLQFIKIRAMGKK